MATTLLVRASALQRFSHAAMPASPIPVVCLVFRNPHDRLLATRRPPQKKLGEPWEFPGCKIERGESPEDALRREFSEELSFTPGALCPLPSFSHRYDFAHIHRQCLINSRNRKRWSPSSR